MGPGVDLEDGRVDVVPRQGLPDRPAERPREPDLRRRRDDRIRRSREPRGRGQAAPGRGVRYVSLEADRSQLGVRAAYGVAQGRRVRTRSNARRHDPLAPKHLTSSPGPNGLAFTAGPSQYVRTWYVTTTAAL